MDLCGAAQTGRLTAYSSRTIPDFGYRRWLLSVSLAREAGDGSIGTPSLSSTGMTAGSTVSPRPASSSVRNSSPPPYSQMSLPKVYRVDRDRRPTGRYAPARPHGFRGGNPWGKGRVDGM